jgi:hypothetical protein
LCGDFNRPFFGSGWSLKISANKTEAQKYIQRVFFQTFHMKAEAEKRREERRIAKRKKKRRKEHVTTGKIEIM